MEIARILYSQFLMEGMIGFLKKRINQDIRYQENLLNQALLQEQMNIVLDFSTFLPSTQVTQFTRLAGHQFLSRSWQKLQGTKYSTEWMEELALIRTYCNSRGKNLDGLDLEKIKLERSWKFEARKTCRYEGIDNTGETFYGEAVVYLRVPETFFDPEASPAADKLFAVTQLFRKRGNLFESEILCQWSDEFRLVPLDQVMRLIGIFQAEDDEGRRFVWILHRHHSDPLINPVLEPETDKALLEGDAGQSDEMDLPDSV
ncbi:hypothetical protein BT69DRAFT_1335136 [Atractiella rhizophila]|nr:hypothetical protein BT69DRAFT_1335136 [Atractiella rhizophila]